jgi:hypothetical protein
MRIVVWNIRQPRDRDRNQKAVVGLRPDVAVIAERRRDIEAPAGCSVWVGADANRNKGLAVLSFGGYRVTLHPAYDPAITWAAPILVTGPHHFFLLAIWNMRPYQYIWDALAKYRRLLTAGPAVVAGDFNVTSRSMFRMGDGTPAPWREEVTQHKDFEFYLQDLRLVSAYHKYFREIPGEESHSTLYFTYKQNLIYHMDFCFIPESWSRRLKSVRVGTYDEWVAPDNRFSDHVPLTVEISMGQAACLNT